jgi:hypothetical protein
MYYRPFAAMDIAARLGDDFRIFCDLDLDFFAKDRSLRAILFGIVPPV